jgi:hypothetical protein
MHGTNAGVLLNILAGGLNERYAGTGAGAAYGKGLYLAEDAVKNDQYTKADLQHGGEPELHHRLYARGAGHHPGMVFYILVCRVALGHQVRTKGSGKLAMSHDTNRRVTDACSPSRSASSIGWTASLRMCFTTRCVHPTRNQQTCATASSSSSTRSTPTPSTCWPTSGSRVIVGRWRACTERGRALEWHHLERITARSARRRGSCVS